MPSGLQLRQALKETGQSTDRSSLLKFQFDQFLTGNANGDAASLITQAISIGNPELLNSMLGVFVPFAQANEKIDIVFDGKKLNSEELAALQTALGLVACEFGLDCTARSQASIATCALAGICGLDLFEAARRNDKTPAVWEQSMRFYSQITDAYRAGNFGIVNTFKRAS